MLIFNFILFLFSVKPARFQFGHAKGRGNGDSVNITCAADHAYPEPILKLYQGQGDRRYAHFFPNASTKFTTFQLNRITVLNIVNYG